MKSGTFILSISYSSKFTSDIVTNESCFELQIEIIQSELANLSK